MPKRRSKARRKESELRKPTVPATDSIGLVPEASRGEGGRAMRVMTIVVSEMNRAAPPNPITPGVKVVSEEKSRSWGLISVGVCRRAPGEMVWSSDYHRISYVLTDISGTKQSDDGPVEEYRLRQGDIAFRPCNRKLWSDLAGGRFIQILQSRETYDNLPIRPSCPVGRSNSIRKMGLAIR